MHFQNDPGLVRLCYHCAKEFGWTIKETLEADESLLDDVMLFGQERGYREWANRHNIEAGHASFDNVADYRQLLGPR